MLHSNAREKYKQDRLPDRSRRQFRRSRVCVPWRPDPGTVSQSELIAPGAWAGTRSRSRQSGLVLFVTDLLHPVGGLAVEALLNGDVSHFAERRGTTVVS